MISAARPIAVTSEARIRVSVVYALPDRYWSVPLELPTGADVAQALAAAGMDEKVPGLDFDAARLAIFSRPATLATRLHDGDRVELLRALAVDPKQSRRQRAAIASKDRPG
jgi:hypothetical protein